MTTPPTDYGQLLPEVEDRPRHYRLWIPGIGKEWITANQRLGWQARSRRTKLWRDVTAWRAVKAQLPALGQAWVICELRFPTARRRDPANWSPTAKACVDGLVDAGVFEDDDHLHVTGPDMRMGPTVASPERGMVIHLMPL